MHVHHKIWRIRTGFCNVFLMKKIDYFCIKINSYASMSFIFALILNALNMHIYMIQMARGWEGLILIRRGLFFEV